MGGVSDKEKIKLLERRFEIIIKLLKRFNEKYEHFIKGGEFMECERCGSICREKDWD